MLSVLLLAAELTCGHYKIDNRSSEPLTEYDYKTIERARDRCQEKFPKTSPCLKVFIKTAPKSYKVICGPKPKIVGE